MIRNGEWGEGLCLVAAKGRCRDVGEGTSKENLRCVGEIGGEVHGYGAAV